MISFNRGDPPEWAKRQREQSDREILARLDRPLDEATTGPVIADLVTTLGVTREQAEVAVRSHTTPVRGDGGHMAAEQVQQWLHDLFVAPSWPPCPEHPRHPLWLDAHRPPRWCCPQTRKPLCELGNLSEVTRMEQPTAATRERFEEELRIQAESVTRLRQQYER